jgi:hypothetical protein
MTLMIVSCCQSPPTPGTPASSSSGPSTVADPPQRSTTNRPPIVTATEAPTSPCVAKFSSNAASTPSNPGSTVPCTEVASDAVIVRTYTSSGIGPGLVGHRVRRTHVAGPRPSHGRSDPGAEARGPHPARPAVPPARVMMVEHVRPKQFHRSSDIHSTGRRRIDSRPEPSG